jgi:protein-L-isoaspartate(D-aspartate) O-methyltransferase
VYSIEVHEALSRQAGENLRAAGAGDVTLVVGDGSRGLPEHAPYEAINVAAAAEEAIPAALLAQLAPGGRLVAPVEDADQHLVVARAGPAGVAIERFERVRFVPLVSGGGPDFV